MAQIMTTRELAEYLKLHEITICKHASQGQIPAKRIGNVWRFDRDAIDAWIKAGGRNTPQARHKSKPKSTKHILRKRSRTRGKGKPR